MPADKVRRAGQAGRAGLELFAGLELAQRLEAAEGWSNAAFVEARAALEPSAGAVWRQIAGAYAMFDGVGSPLTQTFGLGLTQAITPADLEALEAFFRDRGADTAHEVCPLAGVDLAALLVSFGYMPVEMSNVLFRPLDDGAMLTRAADAAVTTRVARADEGATYTDICARGWSEIPELRGFIESITRVSLTRVGGVCLIAEIAGAPIAAGELIVHDGVALLAGASTVPEARRQGAQLALLQARLRLAVERGCDVAMMCAAPGSASQRNAERHGFRIAYTRTKWQRS